ncbi:hypothetical protein ACFXAZ_22635 [Streptomyces sp. NPDC059477]|uniref:hypothetical protein n=1 Tax=Streptomyces sp. NPDC059477 TaxID=3346847 RepID=UPI0036993128
MPGTTSIVTAQTTETAAAISPRLPDADTDADVEAGTSADTEAGTSAGTDAGAGVGDGAAAGVITPPPTD